MKKIVLLLILTLSFTNNYAAVHQDPGREQMLRKKVLSLLEDPGFTIKEDVLTRIIFKLDEKDRIQVIEVKAKNEKVRNFVKKRLENKRIKFFIYHKLFTINALVKKTDG